MTQIPAAPRTTKNMRLRVGANNYEKHANNVKWGKSTTNVEWRGGTPDAVFSDSSVGSHTCSITLVHDYQNPDSLFNWMIDHEGEQVEVEWKPDPSGAFTQTATITIVAPDTGGAIGAFGEDTLACPSTKPVRTFVGLELPEVTSLSPTTGPDEGGTLVTIVGTDLVGVTSVTFDGIPADFVPVSPTVLVAYAPAGTIGTADVVVHAAGGNSPAETYTYA